MRQIHQEHLDFIEECKLVFESDIKRETHWNDDRDLIGLRRGADRDCIQIFELGDEMIFVANVMKIMPGKFVETEEIK